MLFKKLCIPLLWTKVALGRDKCLFARPRFPAFINSHKQVRKPAESNISQTMMLTDCTEGKKSVLLACS